MLLVNFYPVEDTLFRVARAYPVISVALNY